ncbi:MAG TPA: hypothetical protein VMW17_22365 [Candidatus Binatia bacterium]|nr:hypothetical protein [Candidatus Binatia bacterium]
MRYLKKAMMTALAAALVLGSTARVAHAVCGDANGNGAVDIGDALNLAGKIAANGDNHACPGAPYVQADCDVLDVLKDGKVSTSDLTNLVDQIAGVKTLYAACTGPGPIVSCTDGSDSDVGVRSPLPIHTIPAGTITSNQTWPDGCVIDLTGIVYVASGVVVKLQPGAIVKGIGAGTTNPAVLIFLPGSKIDAQGTPQKPIIMTSGQPTGSRSIGDWGGLLLNGKSTVNRPNCINTAEGIPAPYGGCDATDSSGILTYARIEFSGIEFTPNNELNVTTLNGVGNQTKIEHLQSNSGGDDCTEWFGGTVNVKYFVSSACADDQFDWQLGTTGARQYGIGIQFGPFLQVGAQSRGIEADNSEFGFDDLPRSNPLFCNITNIGAKDNDVNIGSDGGWFFRRGTAGLVANGIAANWASGCIKINDPQTYQWACTDGTHLKTSDPFLLVENSQCYHNGSNNTTQIAQSGTGGLCSPTQLYGLWNTNTNHQVQPADGNEGDNPGFPITWASAVVGHGYCKSTPDADGKCNAVGAGSSTLPDFRPTMTMTAQPTDCSKIDGYFEKTNYLGAFEPGGSNWLDTGFGTDSYTRWISFDTN